jgi:DNA-binding HxlR family transcriptional regulator
MAKSETEICPLGPVLELFAGKWKPEVLWHLGTGPKRFNELRRLVPQVSQKMLTQTLRELERDKLVKRTHYKEIPPRVVYEWTKRSETLRPVFEEILAWGQRNLR